jgi:hypothetical protein
LRSLINPLLALGLLSVLAAGAARAGIRAAEIAVSGRINHGAGLGRRADGGLLTCWRRHGISPRRRHEAMPDRRA